MISTERLQPGQELARDGHALNTKMTVIHAVVGEPDVGSELGTNAPRVTDKQWREQIASALSRREFVLHYQPKVDMRSGTVHGLEALIRWRHPDHGLLQPAAFLPLIQDHKLIETLTDWVIAESARQLGEWRSQGVVTSVAVNVSARHLVRTDFLERLIEHLDAVASLHAGALELELMNNATIKELDRIGLSIRACQQLGVAVALDDFGTGCACLARLRQLPVTTLKLDRFFVSGMLHSLADQSIIKGLLSMALDMGITVIADGVDTLAHGEALVAMGCTLGQGYAVAPPMPAVDVPGWAEEFNRVPPWGRHPKHW